MTVQVFFDFDPSPSETTVEPDYEHVELPLCEECRAYTVTRMAEMEVE